MDFKSDTEMTPPSSVAEDAFSLASIGAAIPAAAMCSTPPRSSRPLSAQLAHSAPTSSSSPGGRGGAGAGGVKNFELWERSAASRTGTSLCISAGSYYRHQNRVGSGSDKAAGTTAASISTAASAGIAPLVLTWRGAEPLDKLHMALRVRTYIVDYC